MEKSHLDTIREAYDKVGILYVVRENGAYTYLFPCSKAEMSKGKDISLNELLVSRRPFMEFVNGTIVSY